MNNSNNIKVKSKKKNGVVLKKEEEIFYSGCLFFDITYNRI